MGKNCKLKKYNSLQIIADVIGLQYDKIYYPKYHKNFIYQQAIKKIDKDKSGEISRELLFVNHNINQSGYFNTLYQQYVFPVNNLYIYSVEKIFNNEKQITSDKELIVKISFDSNYHILEIDKRSYLILLFGVDFIPRLVDKMNQIRTDIITP